MKKILVPTDFSPLAETALNIAYNIAIKTGAAIELLHVVEAPHDGGGFSVTGESIQHDGLNDVFVLKCAEIANVNMKKIVNDKKYVGVRFNPKIKIGNLSAHSSKIITEENIDLIVMGTKGGISFLKGIFNKSNTEDVVTHARCMVLTVKEPTDNFKMRNVIFASDFKDDAPEFINNIKQLQNIFDFKLHIICINSFLEKLTDETKIEKKLKEFAKNNHIENYELHIVRDFTEYLGVIEYAGKINADVIALTTHQQKGFSHWLGGLSDDLVNYANTPVLTYKAKT